MMRITPLIVFLLLVAFGLMPGTAPRDARADAVACKNLDGLPKKRRKGGCVTSKDVRDGELSHDEVKNMAGQRSILLASKGMTVPTSGWVIVGASARIDATGAADAVNVICRIEPKGDGVLAPTPYSVEETLNPAEGTAVGVIEATTVYQVAPRKKDTVRVNFNCAQNTAVTMKIIGLTARFVPTLY